MKALLILLISLFLKFEEAFPQSSKLDLSFGDGKGYVTTDFNHDEAGARVYSLPGGKLLAVGISYDRNKDSVTMILTRYTSNGALDNTFGINGIVDTHITTSGDFVDGYWADLNWVTIQPDGKIIMLKVPFGGSLLPLSSTVYRFDESGNPDNSFDGDGTVTINLNGYYVEQLGIFSGAAGKIYVTGDLFTISPVTRMGPMVMRLNSNGSIDSTFDNDGFVIATNYIFAGLSAFAQTDGKIIIGGQS